MMNLLRRSCAVILVAIVAVTSALYFAGTARVDTTSQYVITDLGTLGGHRSDAAGGVNGLGQVAGSAELANMSYHAYLYDPSTQAMTDIHQMGSFAGNNSAANDINEAGQLVGWAEDATGNRHAFLYEKATGVASDLHSRVGLGGPNSSALAINDLGQMVGWSETPDGLLHAFLYDIATETLTDLHPLVTASGYYSKAYGINNSGRIVGAWGDQATETYNFLYSPGSPVIELGTLGVPGWDTSALGITELGRAYGTANAPIPAYVSYGSVSHAFVTAPNSAINSSTDDLGTLGGLYSTVYGMNSSGEAVGEADTAVETVAFLHSGGLIRELNDVVSPGSGWMLRAAQGINDSGQIAGYGFKNGEWRAFLMTPLCGPGLSRTSYLFDQRGGEASVDILPSTNCPSASWQATSNDAWITITSETSGSGAGTVSLVVRENSGPARQGSLTIAGRQFSVTQAGTPVTNCAYSITPLFNSFNEAGGTAIISVTAQQGCLWQAKSNASWVTITSGGAGVGNGTVSYTVTANTGPPRKAVITVAGKSFSIKQKR